MVSQFKQRVIDIKDKVDLYIKLKSDFDPKQQQRDVQFEKKYRI